MGRSFIILLMLSIFGLIGFTLYRQLPLLKTAFTSSSISKILPAKDPAPTFSPVPSTPTPVEPDYENNLAINDYLVSHIALRIKNGDIYCAYSLLDKTDTKVYLISMCEEFTRSSAGKLALVSGQVIPVVLNVTIDGVSLTVKSHTTPQPGSAYASDVKTLFPAQIANTILSDKFAIISTFLQQKIDSQIDNSN